MNDTSKKVFLIGTLLVLVRYLVSTWKFAGAELAVFIWASLPIGLYLLTYLLCAFVLKALMPTHDVVRLWLTIALSIVGSLLLYPTVNQIISGELGQGDSWWEFFNSGINWLAEPFLAFTIAGIVVTLGEMRRKERRGSSSEELLGKPIEDHSEVR